MIGDLATWQRLMAPGVGGMAELRAAAAAGAGLGVAEIERLRRRFSVELVAVAVELGEARKRAIAKFGEETASSLVADRTGVEMASSAAVARHKARSFASAMPTGESVSDLCCGIGGDAMGLRQAGLEVVGVDIDPVRAWMCGVNADCRGICARVEDVGGSWFHLDPARRVEGGRRAFGLEEFSPCPAVWRETIERMRGVVQSGVPRKEPGGGAIKLGPGVDFAEVRSAIGADVALELEYISENGRMSQAVAWVGRLASSDAIRATAIRADRTLSITGERGEPPTGTLGAFLFEADDAIERAGLLGVASLGIGARSLAPGLGLLTGDRPAENEWFTSFQVLASMPWNEKRVRAWLREHDGGIVEVKTRAGLVQPEVLQHSLRDDGGTTHTLFVLRVGRAMQAFITRRVVLGGGA